MAKAALAKAEKALKSRQQTAFKLMEDTRAVIDLYLDAGIEHINREVFVNVLNSVVEVFHLTPTELALAQYTMQSTVSRWLKGTSVPTPVGRKVVFEFLSEYCSEKMQGQ